MIKQLKRNFILTNMGFISLILITIFMVLALHTYSELKNSSNKILKDVIAKSNSDFSFRWNLDSKPDNPSEHDPSTSASSILRTFVIELNSDGTIRNIINENNLEFSDMSVIDDLVSSCLNTGKASGILKEEELRFLVQTRDNITRIAFIDRSGEISAMHSLIVTGLLILFLSFTAFFIISIFLANRIVKPIETSLNQQQQFVANASHELKTPLTIMLANLDIINSHPTDTISSQQKWINYIRKEIKRTTSLVNSLLYLAKSDAQKNSLVSSRLDLSELLLSCYLPFESIAYEKDKQLTSSIQDRVIVSGNSKMLNELFVILIDNALKYSNPKGTVHVKLLASNGKANISINNTTDHPIELCHQKRIFERFYRVDESRSRDQGGFGLGLSIATSIIDIHNGKIVVNSNRKEGTTFTVTLPLA